MQLKTLNPDGSIEEFIDGDGDAFHVKRTFDIAPTLNSAAELRSNGKTGFGGNGIGDYRHIGRLDSRIITMWLKEAGVSWDDHEASAQVIKRKLLDGDFSKFRVHEGTY